MLPTDQADDAHGGVGQPGKDDIARSEVRMADAEMTEGRVLGDEGRSDEKIAVLMWSDGGCSWYQ